ncbi:sigma-70 family RNA polymerase sigma factor [Demequina lignilytica]|uniref:RNA polymerase sigma factor n=1 Tax=Demequina lignilytica TaxID=3051663 RepID=A0AAW7M320_9MICO|nr:MULTISPECIES: sigma-70 family RNA polymerase sigma factor [unclassified Demequina]MDN4477262.1 sigma-70 family RNA polymerase sigma factor [Demequina sp. SYSU T00039-1]MDN4483788.1 sigma-70 family RNA polymerase sigma factor [Demequina sp. SYSU T0a273]MDN4487435.1 sigma-70 family RNA polymerase sigma factor [Demequina sp. SYSU T00039]
MPERTMRRVGMGDEDAAGAAAARPAPDRLAGLLVAAGRGDADAFEAVYDATAASVHGLALRIVRDPEMAQDVTQEVMVEVWRQAARYRPDLGSPRTWILTIAHRRAVDRVRAEQAHSDRLQRHARPEIDVHDQDALVDTMFRQWQATRVRAGLAGLTPLQREALELTYYKGYTNAQLAQALDIPLGTAKARIRDAIIRLRDMWEVTT